MKLQKGDIDQIAKAYKRGEILENLAFSFDVHKSTIARALKSRGVRLRRIGRTSAKSRDVLKEDCKSVSNVYGLTPSEVARMWTIQKGRCLICNKYIMLRHSYQGAVIDHCHASGNVRGLLCRLCNGGLGFFKDNPEWLRSAADYLEAEPLGEIVRSGGLQPSLEQ